mgnify:CR=1 FL=1
MDDDKTIQLGVVLGIYRGAIMSTTGKTKRRMRVSKPSASALTLASCSAVRLLRLAYIEGSRRFLACSVSGIALLDPVNHVYLEVTPEKFAQPADRPDVFYVRLCPKGLQEVKRLKEDPTLLEEPLAAKLNPPAEEPEAAALNGRVWTYHDFGKSVSGARNIVSFMRELPKLWQDKGMGILAEDNTFKTASGAKVSWESLAKRAPECFEVCFTGSTSKEYGRLVLLQFKILLPEMGAEAGHVSMSEPIQTCCSHPPPQGKKNLQKFARRIEQASIGMPDP